VTYEDLPKETLDETVVADRVQRQHKLICAAVKAGRIGELKGMSRKPASESTQSDELRPTAGVTVPKQASQPVTAAAPPQPASAASRPIQKPTTAPVLPVRKPVEAKFAAPATNSQRTMVSGPAASPAVPRPRGPLASADDPVIEAVEIIEEIVLPADAVVVVSELSGKERPSHEKLTIELLGDSLFKSGDRRTIGVMICRGSGRKVVAGAQIMVKVLGSTFRPVIFHARSDTNGLAKIHLQVPQFKAGRAALLVRVLAEGEEVELRRAVTAF
jgi:hypothetical protein